MHSPRSFGEADLWEEGRNRTSLGDSTDVIYLLDTDTCIGWLNHRRPALLTRLEQADPE